MPSDTLTERLARGTVVADRYVIDGALGEGATGIVYAAHRASDHVRVALKVIHRHVCYDEQALGRFQREATILKQLEGMGYSIKPDPGAAKAKKPCHRSG